MAREREDFFAGYDPAELAREHALTLTNRELLLIRVGLGVFLRETNRHDHVYRDLHALLQKLPAPIERQGGEPLAQGSAPDKWLRRSS
jgi:hypothetical protein